MKLMAAERPSQAGHAAESGTNATPLNLDITHHGKMACLPR